MHITNLVVRELGLTLLAEHPPAVSNNGVTTVEFEAAEGHFRVHLVRDSQYLNVKLEEGSKLAAYYNSLFWHEASTAEKIAIPSARFERAFRLSDDEIKHSTFVVKFEKKGTPRSKLGLAELEQVARQIATLHAVNSRVVSDEFRTAVEENYGNIKLYRKRIQKDLIGVLELAVTTEVSRFFVQPKKLVEKVGILTHHLENAREEDEAEKAEHVITHGRLTAETCRFDEEGKLVEITEWENIHLGSPVKDLTTLIISSADREIRRKKFMKVFQVYFYTLVDLRPPNYQLTDLKTWFLDNQAQVVLDGLEALLILLAEVPDDDLRREAALRWESALDDTVDFLTGNYVSDDEQVFFAHKEEDE